jgi:hypothetical protein
MTRRSEKRVSQGKRYALSHPRSGELTCSEWQVDDVLSAGESTEEGIYPAKHNEPEPISSSIGGSQMDK